MELDFKHKRAKKRRRNILAKRLREDQRFGQKVVKDKRRKKPKNLKAYYHHDLLLEDE